MLPDTYSTGKPLKLHLESRTALNTFTGYGEGYVMVNGARLERSVVVLPDRLVPDWPPNAFDELAPEHFAALQGLGCEIVLLGTGNRQRFPGAEVIAPLLRAGIGVEVMDLQAACRTYNILMAEQRKVAAALLFA
jgi:uncharacterized protein